MHILARMHIGTQIPNARTQQYMVKENRESHVCEVCDFVPGHVGEHAPPKQNKMHGFIVEIHMFLTLPRRHVNVRLFN